MTYSYRKGAQRSAPHKLDARTPLGAHPDVFSCMAAHTEGTAPLPDAFDLTAFSPHLLGQSRTDTCFSHALGGAIATTLAAAGQPLGFIPSPALLARITYALEQDAAIPTGQPLPELLSDTGAQLIDVINAAARYGVVPMGADNGEGSDATPILVVQRPDFSSLMEAATHLETGVYGLDPTASNASDTMAAALVSGIELEIAFWADAAFEQLQPGQVAKAPAVNVNDPNEGGHATRLSGFRPSESGVGRDFLLTNSWPGWCDNGRCWVDPSFIGALWEVHAVAVAKTPRFSPSLRNRGA